MNKNEQFVITINRELGSGGRTVGRLLAEKLGVPFYDKAVIKALQEKYHISPEEIERLKGRKHSWWADVERILKIDSGMSMDYYMPKKGDAPDLLTTECSRPRRSSCRTSPPGSRAWWPVAAASTCSACIPTT